MQTAGTGVSQQQSASPLSGLRKNSAGLYLLDPSDIPAKGTYRERTLLEPTQLGFKDTFELHDFLEANPLRTTREQYRGENIDGLAFVEGNRRALAFGPEHVARQGGPVETSDSRYKGLDNIGFTRYVAPKPPPQPSQPSKPAVQPKATPIQKPSQPVTTSKVNQSSPTVQKPAVQPINTSKPSVKPISNPVNPAPAVNTPPPPPPTEAERRAALLSDPQAIRSNFEYRFYDPNIPDIVSERLGLINLPKQFRGLATDATAPGFKPLRTGDRRLLPLQASGLVDFTGDNIPPGQVAPSRPVSPPLRPQAPSRPVSVTQQATRNAEIQQQVQRPRNAPVVQPKVIPINELPVAEVQEADGSISVREVKPWEQSGEDVDNFRRVVNQNGQLIAYERKTDQEISAEGQQSAQAAAVGTSITGPASFSGRGGLAEASQNAQAPGQIGVQSGAATASRGPIGSATSSLGFGNVEGRGIIGIDPNTGQGRLGVMGLPDDIDQDPVTALGDIEYSLDINDPTSVTSNQAQSDLSLGVVSDSINAAVNSGLFGIVGQTDKSRDDPTNSLASLNPNSVSRSSIAVNPAVTNPFSGMLDNNMANAINSTNSRTQSGILSSPVNSSRSSSGTTAAPTSGGTFGGMSANTDPGLAGISAGNGSVGGVGGGQSGPAGVAGSDAAPGTSAGEFGADSDGGGSGGGDGDGSVICTYLWDRGHMGHTRYFIDQEYGRNVNKTILSGYHFWGKPYVRLMRRSKAAFIIGKWLADIWTDELMAKEFPDTHKSTLHGKIITKAGVSICFLIGSLLNLDTSGFSQKKETA